MTSRFALPIDPLLPDVVNSLRDAPSLVLQAPTGAGKTTRLPPALWDAGVSNGLRIVVLEPRRLAARAAAQRIAEERQEPVGQSVGYWVRWDKKFSKQTQILVVTEGIFVSMLQQDPFLEDVGAVVFDEFHERSLQADLSLGLVRNIQQDVRPDLRLVVMSATLAPEPIAAFLHCPFLTSEGRSYPVEMEYLPFPDRRPIHELAAAGVQQITPRAEGDILVFLPGVGEIQRTYSALESWASSQHISLRKLHGSLSHREQEEALQPCPQTRVILSTNVAETSLTIEGVRAVVDTGWARTLNFDTATGLNRLELTRISQASATQRAGRAGRTAPGLGLRLWTENQHSKFRDEDLPEIQRVDISGALLELLHWGEPNIRSFSWLTPPSPEKVELSLQQLQQFEAIDQQEHITPLGHQMARLPLHPRLARLLLAGQAHHCLEEASLLAAMLSEREAFRPPEAHPRERIEDSLDILDRMQTLQAWSNKQDPTFLSHRLRQGAARNIVRVRDQLLRLLAPADSPPTKMEREERTRRALLTAYPDRVALRRQTNPQQARLVTGKGLQIPKSHQPLESELFVCVEMTAGPPGRHADWMLRQASTLQEGWLPSHLLHEQVELEFDPAKERVSAFRRKRYASLILSETRTDIHDPHAAAVTLAQAASEQIVKALSLQSKENQQFLARVRSLAEWMPELGLPRYEEDELLPLLESLCAGKRSFAELRQTPLPQFLLSLLPYPQQQALEREAPERIEVPSGSRIRVQYEEGKPPILAVRIQEMFGLHETPRIAAGRMPVLLHLLAPNMRPQQVTQDLANFWQETYLDVRKELRQRYPKHAWPEDPRNAKPERRPKRRPKNR